MSTAADCADLQVFSCRSTSSPQVWKASRRGRSWWGFPRVFHHLGDVDKWLEIGPAILARRGPMTGPDVSFEHEADLPAERTQTEAEAWLP